MIEVAGTAIGFVTQHQAGPLVIAHGVGARVGEQVDKAFFRLQQEGIVAGSLDGSLALFLVEGSHLFNHLDLEGLGGKLHHVFHC